MNLSDGLGALGVVTVAVSIYISMGLAPTLGFIGMAMLVMAFILARDEAYKAFKARRNGNSE